MEKQIEQARRWLQTTADVTVLTGAGISAESGIPTFRGEQGLWRSYRAEDLATARAFRRNPALVWEWYDWRRCLIAKKKPNAGHRALVKMQQEAREFCLITQNVDGLHDLAGSVGTLKLHGDLWNLRCTHCGFSGSNRQTPLRPLPPRCDCGTVLRPDVVWFGEALPTATLTAAWRRTQTTGLFLVIGTSALVQPAASLPLAAKQQGARLVEVNLERTGLSQLADICLLGAAAQLLPLLCGTTADPELLPG